MKSAYELAMERLNREQGPSRKLTDEQKERISAIENKYEADVAETKLSYQEKLAAVASPAEAATLQEELATSLASLEAKRDRLKEEVWGDAE